MIREFCCCQTKAVINIYHRYKFVQVNIIFHFWDTSIFSKISSGLQNINQKRDQNKNDINRFMYDGLSLYKVSTSYHFWNLSYKPVCKIHILVNLVCKIHDAWISFVMKQKLLSISIMVQSFNIIRFLEPEL